ncbi:MAG: heme exporter protein CcmB [Rhodospirillales bacterium]
MSRFRILLRRELALVMRHGFDSLMVIAFFAVAIVLFPFGVGPDPNMLARIASGIIWVAALLAAMLSLERQFLGDFEDGSLELLAASPAGLFPVAAAKALAHWLTTGLPLTVAAPLFALILGLDGDAMGTLMLALALSTPTLSLLGGAGAALVLGARRGGVLLALLVMPLFIPVLIFGVGAVEAAAGGYAVRPHLTILGGLLLMAAVLCPWATAAALRVANE